jgi:hypothetical protein
MIFLVLYAGLGHSKQDIDKEPISLQYVSFFNEPKEAPSYAYTAT